MQENGTPASRFPVSRACSAPAGLSGPSCGSACPCRTTYKNLVTSSPSRPDRTTWTQTLVRAGSDLDLGEVLEALVVGVGGVGEVGRLGALDGQVGRAAQRAERVHQQRVRAERVQCRG